MILYLKENGRWDMKNFILLLILLSFISCSSLVEIKDTFDNSQSINLPMEKYEFVITSGTLHIVYFYLSREFKAGGNNAIAKLNCKLEGYNGEIIEGNYIEMKIDDVIYKMMLNESRFGAKEKISSSYAQIGAFTFSDTTRTNVNIIAMESIITKDVLDALRNARSITFRILTKNIDGITKNTFRYKPYYQDDLIKFIDYQKK
jgi:hypothetical protein